VEHYGAFVGVAALVSLAVPFATLGSGFLLIKWASRDRENFPQYWGHAVATTLLAGSSLVVMVLAVSEFALPKTIPLRLVGSVALSDLLALSMITIATQAFQACDVLHWTAIVNVLFSSTRLVGAIALAVWHHHPSAVEWGYVYCLTTVMVALVAHLLVIGKLGAPRLSLRRLRSTFIEGLQFSVSSAAQTVYNDIDKTMLVLLSTFGANGIYGAAYRIIDVSCSPILAMTQANFANFFREGASGLQATISYAGPILKRAAAYAFLIFFGFLCFSDLVPRVLGAEYAETAEALRWLAALPLLKSVHFILADALTGAGHQATRTSIQAGVAAFNVAINFWLIPRYSWRGAAWASLASDGLLALSIAVALALLSRRNDDQIASLENSDRCTSEILV
jgi:O-antigen/teichoic acid export membrane protein